MANSCLSCGACCAHFRVACYWAESDPFVGGTVPPALTVPLDRHRVAMRGTACAPVRCAALQGTVGESVRCGIYDRRPSPCRELAPAWHDGQPSPRCDRARAAHGLLPLTPQSWNDPAGPSRPPRVA
ncbi:MAG: YkgJ family cysteine cluster protein [Gammaproteobacteria bacterium]